MFNRFLEFLVLLGGINWGAIAFFDFDIVAYCVGFGLASRIIYGTIGVATVWLLTGYLGNKKAK